MQTVKEWLERLGLPQYAEVFAENDVDLEAMRFLTEGDLEKLGISLGNRKKLLNAIAQLDRTRPPAAAASDKSPDQESPRREAERRQLTVMFCDLVGSTELATKLDPEQLRDLMQAYQRACGEVIARYEGHVAQYLGDGLMVYFGWPRAHEDDAVRAIRAGLGTVQAVSELDAPVPMRARVGIHTGMVVVGETGQGDASVPKAAVGDTPNIAARLQALADPSSVVVSERTTAMARGLFDYAELGVQALKGVAQPVRVYRVSAARTVVSRFDAARDELTLTPLVGREEETALLLRRWQEAKDGEGQVVLVGGEPGIGKSRLTRVLREGLGQERYTVLRSQCSPYHVNSALYPAIEQLERAAGFTREDGVEQKLDKMEAVLAGDARQVAEAAPLLAALLSLPIERYPALNLSAQKQKEKTLEALAGQVEALAKRQPVLMIWEDVHWIDATSQEALDLLVPRLRDLPVLMIVTYRPQYSPRWTDQAHVTTLGLNRLGRRQGVELVAKLTGGKALPKEVLDQVLAHTDGVPLFVEELTKSVLESGLLRDAGDKYTLQATLPALAIPIPTTLRDSLLARLDRLAPVKEVAQIGACIGREFSYELLACISMLSQDQLEQALRRLVEAGLVYRRGIPPDASYTFKHALVQDAAYDSLLKSKRQQLHTQLAQVLKEKFSERVANEPEVLAHHYSEAGNLAAAIPLWRMAGEMAVRRVALREAVGHFQKGLALIGQLPASPERDALELSIREPLTVVWVGLRGWSAADVGVNAAALLQLEQRQGRKKSLRTALWGLWVNTLSQGRVAEALDWAHRVLAEGNEAGDADLQMWGHATIMNSLFYRGQLLEAREHGNQVLAMYDPQRALFGIELTGHDLKTVVGVYSAQWMWILGYPDQAAQISDEKDAHALQMGHAFNLGWALSFGAWVFDYRREPERLLERVSKAARLAGEQSIPLISQVTVPTAEAFARLRSGQLSESISLLRRCIDNWNRLGAYLTVPYVKSALAEAVALQGDLNAAIRLIDECLEQVERPGWQEQWHLAEILRLKGWLLMRQGKSEEAEAELHASIGCARQQQAKSWELRTSTTLAQLLAKQGDRASARELLEPIYNWFTEGFGTKDLKEAKALLTGLT